MPTELAYDHVQKNAKGTLLAETKYMQQYRLRSQLYGAGNNIVAIPDANGHIDFFTSASGKVWNYYPNPSDPSGTGYGVVELKFKFATGEQGELSLAVGTDANNKIVVFAAQAKKLQYIRESNKAGEHRWEHAVDIDLFTKPDNNKPENPKEISRLYTRKIDGALYVGALTKIQIGPDKYKLAYSVWNNVAAPQPFSWAPDSLGSNRCAWSGSTKQTAAFTLLKDAYEDYRIADKRWDKHTLEWHTNQIDRSDRGALAVAAESGHCFCLSSAGDLRILRSEGNNKYSWQSIDDGGYSAMQTASDAHGAIYIFVLDAFNKLHYFKSVDSGASWSAPTALATEVAAMSVTKSTDGAISLFLITGEDQEAIITRMIYVPMDDHWQSYPLTLPMQTTEETEEFFAYSTDITVNDKIGAPLARSEIRIFSSAWTQIIVNNRTHIINHNIPASVYTDTAGMLNIVQPAEVLGAAALQIEVPALRTQFGLRQWEANVLPKLQTVTAESLKDQKLPDGTYLLPEDFRRHGQKVATLASGVETCVNIIQKPALSVAAGINVAQGQYHAGFGTVPPGSALRLGSILAATGFSSQEMNFPSRLPEQQYVQDNQLSRAAGEERWGGSLESFVKAIIKGDIEVVKAHIESAKETVLNFHANLIKKGVEAVKIVAKFIVTTASDALHAVQALFSSAGVTVQKIRKWLAFIFDWDDILRTKKALVHAIDQMMTLSERAIDRIEDKAIKQFKYWQNNLDKGFGELEKRFTGKFGKTCDKRNPQKGSQELEAASNNFLYRAVVDNGKSAKIENPPRPDSEAQDQLVEIMKKMEKGDGAYENSLKELGNINTPDNIYNLALPKLLKYLRIIASSALHGLEKITSGLLKIIRGAIRSINALLSAEWNIPFVSPFYRHITKGSELSAKELIALIIAIPTSAVWKVAKGTAMFKNDDELEDFKKGFIWENLIRLLPGEESTDEHTRTKRSVEAAESDTVWDRFIKKWGSTLAYISGFAGGVSIMTGGMSAYLDFQLFAIISVAAFALGFINPFSGHWGSVTFALSLTALLLDMATIFFPAIGEMSPLAATGLGIALLFTYAMGIAAGEISAPTDIIIAGCYPIVAAFSFLNFKPVKNAIPPPPLTASIIFSVITGILGLTSLITASVAFDLSDSP